MMDITTTFRGLCKAKKSLNKLDGSANGPGGLSAKRPATPFVKLALGVVTVITSIRDQVLARKKDYLDPHSGLSERDRNVIEIETLQRLQACSDSLKELRDDVQHNKTQIKTHRMEILRMVEAYLAGETDH
ncbi:hypothetical protein RvY_05910-4 [Ramazzottius varieornatus]|uniref:Uncharacterized protein n=1 Tax=Ramazzottius varieornatus TaxID=947166 RepID=A0A1D1UX63_RAMVA|nr:hypothetical protein RvY_05910-4 [Ramazzottius varieornatus]